MMFRWCLNSWLILWKRWSSSNRTLSIRTLHLRLPRSYIRNNARCILYNFLINTPLQYFFLKIIVLLWVLIKRCVLKLDVLLLAEEFDLLFKCQVSECIWQLLKSWKKFVATFSIFLKMMVVRVWTILLCMRLLHLFASWEIDSINVFKDLISHLQLIEFLVYRNKLNLQLFNFILKLRVLAILLNKSVWSIALSTLLLSRDVLLVEVLTKC